MKFTSALAVAAATATVAQADVKQSFMNFGVHLSRFNEGVMRAMLADPSSNGTDCLSQTDKASVEIMKLFNISSYFGSTFNIGDFFNQAQIASIQVLSEFEKCGYNEYLIQFDDVMSRIPEVSGMGANLATQAIVGFSDKDTSMYRSYDIFIKAWEDWDWVGIGESVQLFLVSTTKFESADFSQNVVTI